MTIFTLLTEITKKQNTHNNGFQDKGANKSIEGSDSMLNRYLQGELYHWPNLLIEFPSCGAKKDNEGRAKCSP